MPIPAYLKNIAGNEKIKKALTSFAIVCPCGNDTFDIYKNYMTNEEKELCKPYYDALDNSMSPYGSFCTKDEDGTLHYWKYTDPQQKITVECFIPPKPSVLSFSAIKAICSVCHSEFVLFDNRFHGYDGVFNNHSLNEQTKNAEPHFRQIHRKNHAHVKLLITVENEESLEKFNEAAGEDCSLETYSNAFSYITIHTIDHNGRKRKFFDDETA